MTTDYGIKIVKHTIFLPDTLTCKSKHKTIRVIGFLFNFLWFFPAIAVLGIPVLIIVNIELMINLIKNL
jgi:hypothetical protein